jgi:aspartate aminotransferase
MDISERAKRFEFSPIRGLIPFARAAKKEGRKVYHVNIGQPDLESPLPMYDAILEYVTGLKESKQPNPYSASEGTEHLVDAIVSYYRRNLGKALVRDNVRVTAGGSEALLIAMMIAADSGERMIVPEPYYANYDMFAKALGIELVPLTTTFENGFSLGADSNEMKEKLENLIQESGNVKAILYTNPDNPTGHVMTREEVEAIAELCRKHSLFAIADEVYNEIVFDRKHTSILSIPGMDEHAILIDSISKRYSSCGSRIGAMISMNRDVCQAALMFCQSRLSVATIEQHGAVKAYTDGHVPAQEYMDRRDVSMEVLNGREGISVVKPEGALYMVVRFSGVADTHDFARFLLQDFSLGNETVMVAPGSGFYKTPGLGKDEIRLAFVLNNGDMRRACELLAEGYDSYIRRLGSEGSETLYENAG